MMVHFHTIVLLPLFLTCCNVVHMKSSMVSLTLDAKWLDTPLIAEASEYLASESRSLFWQFVQLLSSHSSAADLTGPDEVATYQLVDRLAGQLLSNEQHRLMRLSLASRAYSPTVEMNNQLAGQRVVGCPDGPTVWGQHGEGVLCTFQELEAVLSEIASGKTSDSATNTSSNPVVYKTDKIYPQSSHVTTSGSAAPTDVIVVYGDLRLTTTYTWHSRLVRAVQEGHCLYVFRHYIKERGSKKTRLSGYGVELAIKSTEYKAVDDTKVQAEDASGGGGAGRSPDDAKPKQSVGDTGSNSSAASDEVKGFVFSRLRELHPELGDELNTFKQHLTDYDEEIKPLKAWQFQELSLQAAYQVASAARAGQGQGVSLFLGQGSGSQALETLRDLSQNYPLRASGLAAVSVPNEFRQEVLENQRVLENTYGLSPGHTLLTLNGHTISKELDVFAILELARRETRVMTRLHNLGIRGTHLSSILMTPLTGSASSSNSNSGSTPTSTTGSSGTGYLLDIRTAPTVFLNNLETDRRYSNWPHSVQDLLTPAYAGMLRRVAKNLFNLIVVVDPAAPACREVVQYAEAFIVHQAPVRIGFLWGVDPAIPIDQSPGRALIRVFNFITQTRADPVEAVGFITDFYTRVPSTGVAESVTGDLVKNYFKLRFGDSNMQAVFGEESEYDANVKTSWEYLISSGIAGSRLPFALLNGALIDSKTLQETGFEDSIVSTILEQTVDFQRAVYATQLTDYVSVLDYLSDHGNMVPRLNKRVLDKEGGHFLEFGLVDFQRAQPSDIDPRTVTEDHLPTLLADRMVYFHKNDDANAVRPVTMWLVTDLTTANGRAVAYEAFRHLKVSAPVRLGLVHNLPDTVGGAQQQGEEHELMLRYIRAMEVAKVKLAPIAARNFVTKLVKEENVAERKSLEELAVGGMDWQSFDKFLTNQTTDFLLFHREFVRRTLGMKPGQIAVIANGKILGPLAANETFTKDDFKLLERVTEDAGGQQISQRLSTLFGGMATPERISELTARVLSVLLGAGASTVGGGEQLVGLGANGRRVELRDLKERHSGVRQLGDLSQPTYDITAVIDPLSRDAQKISHILIILSEALNCNVRLVFNCKDKLSEAPLKSFYRFVWDASPIKKADGSSETLSNPRALFSRLPGQPLLTLGVDAPHGWLVESTRSLYDLDNLRMSELPQGTNVNAAFELEYLLLEGHCFDQTTGQPPRGLQFVLGTATRPDMYDTIVMANLGYFQLKANPGAWYLKLRDGKSKEIYNIASHDFTDSSPGSSDVVSVLDNFRPKIIRVRVAKKADKLRENLLGTGEEEDGIPGADSIWSSISSAFGSGKKSTEKDDTLNIFSLASGHLYERFLRLMMLSVMKHTRSKVKFWFLKNYLSPTFKQFIPHMSKEYGFDYELVQYKWPRWLHQQTEKQRIIWGYKILFLDVLFPLGVKKIIFVDADQIVRADLQQLADLDLEGAPYGYTPFCNSRREMDGFRFWTTGYWAQHLAGRPYHISALYVVDLVRFRRMAAGDRLRGQYHGLSQDPNSLSNLDQDLPNNMIHQVPIKSLPQEWLWCETWCSDTEKSRAKTIDLCNNPQTKEPKLSAAVRIIAEWTDYDQEIKRLWDRVYGTKTAAGAVPSSDKTAPSSDKTAPTSDKPTKTEL